MLNVTSFFCVEHYALMNEKCHHWDLKVRKDGF